MARIRAGESCGVCHGRVAFGIDACARCHDGIPPAPKPVAEAPRTPVEAASNWYEASRLLPAAGERPDWDRALADGVIAPRAGLDPGAEAEEVLPLDVEMVPDGDEELKVVFSHETHTEWLTCDNCHDEIFEAEAGAATVTMETIEEGKHCGACHGSVAFAADDIETCGRCHPGLGA